MLSTTVTKALYTLITGISNNVTWHLNDPWKAPNDVTSHPLEGEGENKVHNIWCCRRKVVSLHLQSITRFFYDNDKIKAMRRLSLLFTILMAVMLVTSCQKELPDAVKNIDVNQGDKTSNSTSKEKYLRVSAESLSFTSPAGSLSFTITSNTSWSLKSDQDWCMVSLSSGLGNGTITVNVIENASTSSRSATITISSNDVGNVKVNVTQAGADSGLQLNKNNLSFTAEAGSDTFTISSNTNWTVESDQTWCTVNTSSGSNNGTITVNVSENTSTDLRSATITVKAEELLQVIAVTQMGANATLQTDKSSLSFEASIGSDIFTITSNTKWSIASDQVWCTLSPTSGSDNATVIVTVTENISTFSRSATITVKAGDLSKTIAVTQAGAVITNQNYFWFGDSEPTIANYTTLEGLVSTYDSLDDALAFHPRFLCEQGKTAFVLCPSRWNLNVDYVVVQENKTGKVYNLQKIGIDIPGYDLFQTTERTTAQATIELKTKADADELIAKIEGTNNNNNNNLDTKKFTVNGISFNMIRVDGGTYTMGATSEQGKDAYNSEKPAHQVTLSSYYIGETEVTQELWRAVMGSNPSNFSGSRKPVENVSWDDCHEFVRKLNSLTGQSFRLPTEAEWEFAARGGNKSKGYKYAGSNSIGDVAWYSDNGNSQTHDVAQKSPNELGLYDMSGNVWEWCLDWYDIFSNSSQTNPTGPTSGSHRVYRGGSWLDIARHCRVSLRDYGSSGDTKNYLGFRLAL